jgi:RNA polymerase sigma-70 factor, ECF subfamily
MSETTGMERRALSGDREAFDAMIGSSLQRLRAVVRRMIGHPEDTEDVVQESLLRAWNGRTGFRQDASFATWLCAIGARAAVDHLRQRKRWRARAQVAYANACYDSPELQMEVGAAYSAPDFVYEAKEHIAYCFTCVGRSLEPGEQAALVLIEVLGLPAREAATSMGLSESSFRHVLSRARTTMEQTYEGLCSLVNKTGVCYQCKGLREAAPPGREGGPIPVMQSFEDRLDIVRRANVDSGVSQALHDLFWRRTSEVEDAGTVSDSPESGCGEEDEAEGADGPARTMQSGDRQTE